jgi:hypothetical protein
MIRIYNEESILTFCSLLYSSLFFCGSNSTKSITMKFFAALLVLAASAVSANPLVRKSNARDTYVRSLMKSAIPTANSQLHNRRLDQNAAAEDFEVNIASFFVKFEQCQFVKSYSDDMALNNAVDTVLYTSRFVLFKLCPNECSSCSTGFGEYLVDLDQYLEATVEYFKDEQEQMCEACNQNCAAAADGEDAAADGDGARRKLYTLDCTTCADECEKIQNMEANGYIDATNFLECAMIFDPDDDTKPTLYAAPICASGGTKIKIGVFTDQYCYINDSTKEIDDYLQNNDGTAMKLSNALLKNTYTDTCISCAEAEDGNDHDNDQADNDKVIELCENLYEDAAKCETVNGFYNGTAAVAGYENQVANEKTVCDFMSSIKAGTYDEDGQIIVSGAQSVGASGKSTNGAQKFCLTFFILGTLGLAVYAAMLHSKLVKGGKTDLSVGAMA